MNSNLPLFASTPIVVAPTSSVVPYVVATISMAAIGACAVVSVVVFRPAMDNTGLITEILGFLTTTLAATLAYLKSQDTHLVVNGRMDEFKRLVEEAAQRAADSAYQRGMADGRVVGREAADRRTDLLAGPTAVANVAKVASAVESSVRAQTSEHDRAHVPDDENTVAVQRNTRALIANTEGMK